jgi:soluble lytic murein transglycosylase-like protein
METRKVIIFLLLFISSLIIYEVSNIPEQIVIRKYANLESSNGEVNIPTSLLMYEMIEKYSDIYEIPKHVAYNVAFRETRYRGPLHWNYIPYQTSSAGAVGPMQIMPATGRSVYKMLGYKKRLNTDVLKTDIELNVMISMKVLRLFYNRHKRWDLACGAYNTGRPLLNDYAIYCANNMDYKKKWVSDGI